MPETHLVRIAIEISRPKTATMILTLVAIVLLSSQEHGGIIVAIVLTLMVCILTVQLQWLLKVLCGVHGKDTSTRLRRLK